MADTPAPDDSKRTKQGRGKSVLMVLGLLGFEAALIIGAMMLFMREPDVTAANDGEIPAADLTEQERITEILIVDGKLPNAKTGVTYLYDAEIYVQVKKKHEERVLSELDQFANEIKSEITAIWRTSDPRHFQEPKLENLTRKVHALLNERFGTDVETGELILVKCVIVMGTGFRVDV
jgi:hypothetical protein